MKFRHWIALTLIASMAPSSGAQENRQTATAIYLELLARRGLPDAGQPADPALSENTSPTVPSDDLPPGYMIIEGDIVIPIEEWQAQGGRPSRSAVFGTVNYWGSTVPYDFDTSVTQNQQQAAIAAMIAISNRAGIAFRAKQSDDSDWIRFQARTVNKFYGGPLRGACRPFES